MFGLNENVFIIIVGTIISIVMISVAYVINGKSQPKQLWMLFFTEMWERFSFYGMRALFILYLTKVLTMAEDEANYQYGAYNALVYATPLLGGWLADKYLGYRKTILLGGILMAIGHLVLALPTQTSFFLGLGFLIAGNGFFKPNISSFLGKYYDNTNFSKDAGYAIFYMGVNIGAFLGGLVCGYVGQEIDWHYGFGLAGIFMVLGLIVFVTFRHILGEGGYETNKEFVSQEKFGIKIEYLMYIGAFLMVPLCMFLVKGYQITGWLFGILAVLTFVYLVYLCMQFDKEAREKMMAAIILIIFWAIFCGFYEQQGGSLNLMAARNVDFLLSGATKPLSSAMMNNSVNPFYIILITPLLGMFWTYADRNWNWFNIPVKFGISFILIAIGYYIFYLGGNAGIANQTGLMPLYFFMFAYLFITLGELFISPIGLSMITKLSPGHMFGLMMGVWFLASSLGHKLAGWIGAQMAIPKLNPITNLEFTPIESLPIYQQGCYQIALYSLIGGVFILIFSKVIQKWMHGVK